MVVDNDKNFLKYLNNRKKKINITTKSV